MFSLYRNYKQQQKYNTFNRAPFFELARGYMPKGSGKVLDIGAGGSSFVDLFKPEQNVYLLDGNPTTIEELKAKRYNNVILHKIPGKMPFADNFIDYIHCSHVIEHLSYDDCYTFVKDVDRILKPGGVLVISAPTFHPDFYNDFSHIKPYHPSVFLKYLVYGISEGASAAPLSGGYTKLALVFRYTLSTPTTYMGSENRLLDFCFYLWRQAKVMLGIKVYQRSGYTLVLKKNDGG